MSNSNEKVSFQQFHEPPLKAGDYTIEVTQRLNNVPEGPTDPFTAKQRIFVAGERFSIPQSKVYHCFPPRGNVGDHANDLPSIMLTRSTLPWERFAEADNLELPWLYLFVFDDDDIKNGYVKVSSKAIQDVVDFDSQKTGANFIQLNSEPGEISGTALNQAYKPANVNVVEIDVTWANQYNVLPTTNDLGLITGVRVDTEKAAIITPGSGSGSFPGVGSSSEVVTTETPDSELAICIANRLPKQGVRSYAHLLSLEGRVIAATTGANAKPAHISLSSQGVNGDYCSFISLYDWSFTCTEETGETFPELLNGLHQFNFGLPPLPTTGANAVTGASIANNFLEKGAVALPHHLKEGGKAASWYHGPLIGGTGNTTNSALKALPVKHSDELLILDKDLLMLNTSYAAAWELGRMLTLNNKSLSMDLYAWKRQQAWIQKQHPGDSTFHNLQPAANKAAKAQGLADQEAKIKTWFDSLSVLDNVPFNYLVPDETLLPSESIRFYQLDQYWIQCLLNGAYSIGHVAGEDTLPASFYKYNAAADANPTAVSGFLLRSQVVSDWPTLMVESPSVRPTITNPDPATTYLPKLRMERLAPDILFCLFEGEATYFDIHLKPETIHFGFNRPDVAGSNDYTKDICFSFNGDTPSEVSGKSVDIQWRALPGADDPSVYNEARIVDLDAIKTGIEGTAGIITGSMNSAQFAMEMVKGVPRIYFDNGTYETIEGAEYEYHAPPETEENPSLGSKQDGVPPHGGGDQGDVIPPDAGPGQQEKNWIEKLEQGAEAGVKAIEEKLEGHAETPTIIKETPNPNTMDKDATKTSDLEKVIEKLEGEFPDLKGDLKDFLEHKKGAADGLHLKGKGLKHDIQKAIKDIKNLEPEVTDEVKEKLHEIEEKIEASPLLNMNSAKVRKAWVIGTLVLLLVSTVLWTVTTIIDRERPQPLVFHFQGVKEMQEIEFVKQDYEELVPIATKNGELEFLLTVPASVSGKMDMTMMQYEVEGDTVIKVTLPNPIVTDPVLNMAEIKDYYDRGGGDKLFLSGGGASYSKAYEQIISSMDETKKGILANAVKDDIIEETNKKARSYLINLAGAIGYHIEFVLKEPDPSWEDDMKKRLGKTYDKVKNKVEGHSGILKRIKDDLTRKKSNDSKTDTK